MSDKVVEINAETNEIIQRDPTDEEIKDFEQNRQNYEARVASEASRVAAKAAILDKLGITEEDARLLLS
jgi:hypothetical protein